MGKRATAVQRQIVQEAARIICEERMTDYRMAKHKAAERLGLGFKAGMPDNAQIQAAVIEYQRLFGGRGYAERLQLLRETALRAMDLLKDFQPRLVGAVASGATTDEHKVRLHGFADKPELLDLYLSGRGIPFDMGDRRYRYPDGRTAQVPTCEFSAGDVDIEMAVFATSELRRAPLSPVDGQPVKRLTYREVEQLTRGVVDLAAPC